MFIDFGALTAAKPENVRRLARALHVPAVDQLQHRTLVRETLTAMGRLARTAAGTLPRDLAGAPRAPTQAQPWDGWEPSPGQPTGSRGLDE